MKLEMLSKIKVGKHHAICFLAMLWIAYGKEESWPLPDMPDVYYKTTAGKIRRFRWGDDKVQNLTMSWKYFLKKDYSELKEDYPGILLKLFETSILITQGRIKVVEKKEGGNGILDEYEAQINKII